MISNRIVAIAVCATIGIASIAQSDLAFAKKKNKNKNEETTQVVNNGAAKGSYPNGRPWQAMEADFDEVLYRLYKIKKDTENILVGLDEVDADHVIIKNDLTDIKATLDEIQNGLDSIGAGVASLTNTLDIQVSVAPASADDRNDVNDAPVQLFVQVTQNGVGVTGLTSADFGYSNSFPLDGAIYCGNACFVAGENGLYGIELQGDWGAAPYAGTLSTQLTTSTPDGDVMASGASLVSFEIPAAPAP
jgi:hypothetical protein